MLYWIFFIIILLVIFILILGYYLYNNPTVALTPYNIFVSMITSNQPYYTKKEKDKIFPTGLELEENWQNIRDEAVGVFDYIQGNVTKNFIKNTDDFWKGWNTFPLRMFGQDIKVNMDMCPTVSRILYKCRDQVPTAFFSVMEPYKHLDAHYGPFKGILRYQLGLVIPPPESGECYISVDGITYTWKNGESTLFDETYLHFVHNDTPYHRIILFLDIKRPFRTSAMTSINDFLLWLMKISPHNQKVVKSHSTQLLNKLAYSQDTEDEYNTDVSDVFSNFHGDNNWF